MTLRSIRQKIDLLISNLLRAGPAAAEEADFDLGADFELGLRGMAAKQRLTAQRAQASEADFRYRWTEGEEAKIRELYAAVL